MREEGEERSEKKKRDKDRGERGREEESKTSREGDLARLPLNRGYLRLISKESCQVFADTVLTETRK